MTLNPYPNFDQKAAKCTTCRRLCGNFKLFIARQWPENRSTSFKTRFSAISPGANELSLFMNMWRQHLFIGIPMSTGIADCNIDYVNYYVD